MTLNPSDSQKKPWKGQEWGQLREDVTLGLQIGCLSWSKRCHFYVLYCLAESCDQVTISCTTLSDTDDKKAIFEVLQVYLQFYREMFLLKQSRTSPDLTFWNACKVCPRQPLKKEPSLSLGAAVTFKWETSAARLWQLIFFLSVWVRRLRCWISDPAAKIRKILA